MQTTFVPCKGDALGHRVDVGEQRKLRVRSFVFKCGGMSRTLVLSAEVSPETLEMEEAPLMLLLLHLLVDNVGLERAPPNSHKYLQEEKTEKKRDSRNLSMECMLLPGA